MRDTKERADLYASIERTNNRRRIPIDLETEDGSYARHRMPTLEQSSAHRTHPNHLGDIEEEHARDPRDEAGPLTPLATSRPQSPFTQYPTIDFDGLSWPSKHVAATTRGRVTND